MNKLCQLEKVNLIHWTSLLVANGDDFGKTTLPQFVKVNQKSIGKKVEIEKR